MSATTRFSTANAVEPMLGPNDAANLRTVITAILADIADLRAWATEMASDHATFKTAADQVETLIEELHDDHATFKTIVDELKLDYNATLTKLDADAGVTDADYAATNSVAATGPATLTAAKPASAPATLTESVSAATAVALTEL